MPVERPRKVSSYATAILGVMLAVRAVAVILSPAGLGWDYRQYHMAGERAFEGRMADLYKMPRSVMDEWNRDYLGDREAGTAEESSLPAGNVESDPDELVNSGRLGYVGFPLSAYVWATFGGFSPRAGMVVFKIECALSLALALCLLYPGFRDTARSGVATLPLFLGIVLLYEPFWFSFSTGGQATPHAFLLLVLFWNSLIKDRLVWAGLFLALAIPIKPFLVVLLPMLVLAREIRVTAITLVALTVAVGTSVWMFGVPLHLEWWSTMRVSAGAIAEPWWQNAAILGMVYSFWTFAAGAPLQMIGEPSSTVVEFAISGFKFLVIGLCFYRAATLVRHDLDMPGRRHYATSLGVLLGLFFSSLIWPHYLTFLFLPLIFWLVPRHPLPIPAAILAWLTLLSTLSVHSRFLQHWVLSLLDRFPFLQTATAAFFGSVTLSLAFVLFVGYWTPILGSLKGSVLVRSGLRTRPRPQ